MNSHDSWRGSWFGKEGAEVRIRVRVRVGEEDIITVKKGFCPSTVLAHEIKDSSIQASQFTVWT